MKFETLSSNTYPGRGIIIGKSADGMHAVIAYFIMGRSVNSRNRLFVEKGNSIRTQAIDPDKLTDPSLVIYSPMRVYDYSIIVSNGDQTDTIYDYLKDDSTFEDALRTRSYEPDEPNFTPRISGVVRLVRGGFKYKLSILKNGSAGREGPCNRFFYEYTQPQNGVGHLIHTYSGDGDPLPSFSGDPVTVEVGSDREAYAKALWESLDNDNKVALLVRFIDITTGEFKTTIINKGI